MNIEEKKDKKQIVIKNNADDSIDNKSIKNSSGNLEHNQIGLQNKKFNKKDRSSSLGDFYLTAVNNIEYDKPLHYRRESTRMVKTKEENESLKNTKSEFIDYLLHENTKYADFESVEMDMRHELQDEKSIYDDHLKEIKQKQAQLKYLTKLIEEEVIQQKKNSAQKIIEEFNNKINETKHKTALINFDYNTNLKIYSRAKEEGEVIRKNLLSIFKESKLVDEQYKKFSLLKGNIFYTLSKEEKIFNDLKEFESMSSINYYTQFEKKKEHFNYIDFKLYLAKNLTVQGKIILSEIKKKQQEVKQHLKQKDEENKFRFIEVLQLKKDVKNQIYNNEKLNQTLKVDDINQIVNAFKNAEQNVSNNQTRFAFINEKIIKSNNELTKLAKLLEIKKNKLRNNNSENNVDDGFFEDKYLDDVIRRNEENKNKKEVVTNEDSLLCSRFQGNFTKEQLNYLKLQEEVLDSNDKMKLMKVKLDEYKQTNKELKDNFEKLEITLKKLIAFIADGISKLLEVKITMAENSSLKINKTIDKDYDQINFGLNKSKEKRKLNSGDHWNMASNVVRKSILIKKMISEGKRKNSMFKLNDFSQLMRSFHRFSRDLLLVSNLIKVNIIVMLYKESTEDNILNSANEFNSNLFKKRILCFNDNNLIYERLKELVNKKITEADSKKKFMQRSEEDILQKAASTKNNRNFKKHKTNYHPQSKQFISSTKLCDDFYTYYSTKKGSSHFLKDSNASTNTKFLKEVSKLTNSLVKFDNHTNTKYSNHDSSSKTLDYCKSTTYGSEKVVQEENFTKLIPKKLHQSDHYKVKSIAKKYNKNDFTLSDYLLKDLERQNELSKVVSIKMDRKRKEIEYDMKLKERNYQNKTADLMYVPPINKNEKNNDDSYLSEKEEEEEVTREDKLSNLFNRLNKNDAAGNDVFQRSMKLAKLELKYKKIVKKRKPVNFSEFQLKFNSTKKEL